MTALPVSSPVTVFTRPATPADVPAMVGLMTPYIGMGDLLPRSAADLQRDIETYAVATDQHGVVIGMGALKPYSSSLAEVIALAVSPRAQGQGVGLGLVERLLQRAADLGFPEVFALTRVPGFFHRLGFTTVEKSRFPLKVWFDCARCSRRHSCDEIAVHLTDVASRRHSA